MVRNREQGMTFVESVIAMCLLTLSVQALFLSSHLTVKMREWVAHKQQASVHLESLLQRMTLTTPCDKGTTSLIETLAASEATQAYLSALYDMDSYTYAIGQVPLESTHMDARTLAERVVEQSQWTNATQVMNKAEWQQILEQHQICFTVDYDTVWTVDTSKVMLIGVVGSKVHQDEVLAMQWCVK